ncbi:sporulation protein YunB [Desulfotomaculum nigrificans CO-1-SRB]|uniref:Sporulation protein YunB n=1 Tax=Desulfotomaculum nigrificans (strain DSM 14880 / VKM B-2319 / CO-1-SRB) TaxID=868595 RepID=F6B427_DESCC|nr:sporulation protein YunB [Desulfotomaculum nigrificans CO-1-SRB]
MFRKKKHVPKKVILLLIILGLMGIFVFFDRVLQPTLFSLAKVQAIHMATEILNQTVYDKLSDKQIKYQDLVQIHKDASGKIVLMQADAVKINQLSTEMTLKVQQSLRNLNDEHIGIPLGQLLGIHLLAALGPEFTVHMIPVGTVRVDIIDKFEGAGINQTRHLIWLDLSSEFRIAVPLYNEAFKVNTKVPLAEYIIVGDVPPALVTLQGGVIGN